MSENELPEGMHQLPEETFVRFKRTRNEANRSMLEAKNAEMAHQLLVANTMSDLGMDIQFTRWCLDCGVIRPSRIAKCVCEGEQ